MRLMAAVITLLIIAVPLVSCIPALGQVIDSTSVQHGIMVSGSADIYVSPDLARVTLGVRTRADTAQKASTDNAAAFQKVMQSIRRLGIPDTDIQTAQYTLQPVYQYPQNAAPVLVGYEATNLIRLTVRNLQQVGPVVDAAVKAGANVVQDISFSLANETAVQAEVLTKAVEDGKSKAAVIAKALDVKLGPLLNANEVSAPIVTPVFARAEMTGGGGTPVSPGQIEVRATINLVFAISL